MKLKLTLEMDNSAFDDGNNRHSETARILSKLADKLEMNPGCTEGRLVDLNGNTVGQWSVVAVRKD